ncbi:MAG: hypothetical protein Q7K03_08355 [Dehalococcoidia bacterium]|nr:hypothetical protein [Dehalococcoidia bacterium]
MPINVNKTNTKIMKTSSGWVKAIYDTGQLDADDKPVLVTAHLTQASIEVSAGVLLPKARVKTILEAALNTIDVAKEQELAAL